MLQGRTKNHRDISHLCLRLVFTTNNYSFVESLFLCQLISFTQLHISPAFIHSIFFSESWSPSKLIFFCSFLTTRTWSYRLSFLSPHRSSLFFHLGSLQHTTYHIFVEWTLSNTNSRVLAQFFSIPAGRLSFLQRCNASYSDVHLNFFLLNYLL